MWITGKICPGKIGQESTYKCVNHTDNNHSPPYEIGGGDTHLGNGEEKPLVSLENPLPSQWRRETFVAWNGEAKPFVALAKPCSLGSENTDVLVKVKRNLGILVVKLLTFL
jgi:hypothetical protein